MSIQVALHHVTHYRYNKRIALGPQIVRLRPAPHARTRVLSYSLRVLPATHFINWQQDPQSNYLARLVFPEKTREFRVEVDLLVEMSVQNPFDFFLEPEAMEFPFSYADSLSGELAPFVKTAPMTPLLEAFVDSVSREPMPTNDFLVALNQRLMGAVSYGIRMEPGVQTPEETLEKAAGSCRDSAWLMVAVLRHLGLAARFVSGYLIQLKPDVKSLDGPSGTEVDFTDLHAWCEVYLPGAGWVGLDPTSGLFAGEGHIPLACSPEPSSAAPIEGAVEACKVEFEHSMKITRVLEPPRVTLPYTDAQWTNIKALGRKIDRDLSRHDVRLTQGGEPTFVSFDDRDGAEWNTEAMGPKKRILSSTLFARLKEKYAPLGLQHFGQGKWYPGEQLPRWSLNLYWRKDGEALWSDPALCAEEDKEYGATTAKAGAFLRGVARRLKITTEYVFPAFEDTFYYLWRERNLPINVDPLDSRVDDPLERARLRKVFDQGLGKTVGWVLPLARDPSGEAWQTSPWFVREGRCYLMPGDSPVGLRLPLDRQPWVSKADYPYSHPLDPGEKQPPLAKKNDAGDKAKKAVKMVAGRDPRIPELFESADWVARTAMCAEARGGRLYVFMPPTPVLENYLEVVAAVEATAKAMKMPVVIEGYEPPKDARLTVLRVTPDPGVIEVNVQPVASWDELVEQTTSLYDMAHATRLSSEKFMLDGRHIGTGGGNHFVFGGVTPIDSPFLRRPDLLASMIAYWHNHPALSYLFSGLFVGPTSQAPRIDEARNDSVYEIEVALAEMRKRTEESTGPCPPWLVDRLLRNLLIDVTGNTHRAEFCIDKLYSPDSSTGRLGLLEMRGFEMPPHAQMSLAQQLLMRALLARFWQEPYQPNRLKRWGTELHDRFMLPHCIWEDFCDVITELQEFGYALQPEWFAPHFEFRFPKLGDFVAKNVEVQLRLALEPWHVMGEENAGGGAVRFVDASVERIEVKVTGLVEDRHVLACNGRAIPLQPTGVPGEFVGAVRYRAWQPSSCLHPTIPVHAPLTIDLVDTWMARSLGGCQYHVSHPGGRSSETFPINALEAEARRLARFFRTGHTPGEVKLPREERNPDFPFTLDLRRG
ncbi:transglutaminase family protein [Uliginosibacterium flavum]|uniref:Transglutaminase family protein n=1 Tax=Uliginosibacterium flavum TaxID=1396831 RepID=A0ABV2TJT0_9RHOO